MQSLRKQIVYNVLGQSALALLTVLSAKYIYQLLGHDSLGILYFCLAVNATLMGVLDKGINSTTVREISKVGERLLPSLVTFVRTGATISWAMFFAVASLFIILTPLIVDAWLVLEEHNTNETVYQIRILFISLSLAFPISYYGSLLRGIEYVGLVNLLDISGSILLNVGILYILINEGSFSDVVAWVGVAFLLKTSLYFVSCARILGSKYLYPAFDYEEIKRVFHFARDMVIISMTAVLQRQLDKLLISKLLPISQLGIYGVLSSLFLKVSLAASSVSGAAFPRFCRLHAQDKREDQLHLFRLLQDAVCFGIVPILAAACFAAQPLLAYMFTKEVALNYFVIIVLMAFAVFLNAALSVPYRMLVAWGAQKVIVRQNIILLLVIVPVAIIITTMFGVLGAAVSGVLYFLGGYFFIAPGLSGLGIKIYAGEFIFQVARVVVSALVTYGIAYWHYWENTDRTLFAICGIYLFATMFYLALAYRLSTCEFKRIVRKAVFR